MSLEAFNELNQNGETMKSEVKADDTHSTVMIEHRRRHGGLDV